MFLGARSWETHLPAHERTFFGPRGSGPGRLTLTIRFYCQILETDPIIQFMATLGP